MSAVSSVNPNRLGVTFDGGYGVVRVYSASATSLQCCLLDAENPREITETFDLVRGENDIWEGRSKKLVVGTKYALRVDGPTGPLHSFNSSLNLIDPYAKAVERLSAREYYCVAIDESFDWQGVEKPNTPMSETVIYEAHLRGLTRGNPDIPDDIRGTYAALAHESTINHLLSIGVTAVE
ncbi:MAG: hypothetical protein ACKOWE_01705 [Micrococcales bacterium]